MSPELLNRIAAAAGFAPEVHPTRQPKLIGLVKLSEQGRFLYGIPPADFERIAAAVAAECARIVMAQDVDPAFKGRMASAFASRFTLSDLPR